MGDDIVNTTLNIGDVVKVQVRRTEVYGLFCEYQSHEILVLIPDISWIPCFNSCLKFAAVGDTLDVKIVNIDKEKNKIAGSIRAIHPENDPWDGGWKMSIGDVIDAKVVRWLEHADRCGDDGGYLLALKPGAFVMLCNQPSGSLIQGEKCTVRITSIDTRRHSVKVELMR